LTRTKKFLHRRLAQAQKKKANIIKKECTKGLERKGSSEATGTWTLPRRTRLQEKVSFDGVPEDKRESKQKGKEWARPPRRPRSKGKKKRLTTKRGKRNLMHVHEESLNKKRSLGIRRCPRTPNLNTKESAVGRKKAESCSITCLQRNCKISAGKGNEPGGEASAGNVAFWGNRKRC